MLKVYLCVPFEVKACKGAREAKMPTQVKGFVVFSGQLLRFRRLLKASSVHGHFICFASGWNLQCKKGAPIKLFVIFSLVVNLFK